MGARWLALLLWTVQKAARWCYVAIGCFWASTLLQPSHLVVFICSNSWNNILAEDNSKMGQILKKKILVIQFGGWEVWFGTGKNCYQNTKNVFRITSSKLHKPDICLNTYISEFFIFYLHDYYIYDDIYRP